MKNHLLISKSLLSAGMSVLMCGCASQAQTNLDVPQDPYPWCADQRREAAQFAPQWDGTRENEELRQAHMNANVDVACRNGTIDVPTHP